MQSLGVYNYLQRLLRAYGHEHNEACSISEQICEHLNEHDFLMLENTSQATSNQIHFVKVEKLNIELK